MAEGRKNPPKRSNLPKPGIYMKIRSHQSRQRGGTLNPAAAAAQRRSSKLGSTARRNPSAKRNPAHAAAVAARTSGKWGARDRRDHTYSKRDVLDNVSPGYPKRTGLYVSGPYPRLGSQRYNLRTYRDADVSMTNPPNWE
jgi:hypothetical protein